MGVFIFKANLLMVWLVVFVSLSVLAPVSAQDLIKSTSINGRDFEVSLAPRDNQCQQPSKLILRKMVCMAVLIKSSDKAWLKDLKLSRFDAVMPEHRHGMVTKPKIKSATPGEFLVDQTRGSGLSEFTQRR